MKTLHKTLCLLALMLTATFVLTSCDKDDDIGYDISGTWYGDLQMVHDGERAEYSEIYFKAEDGVFDWKRGNGYEIDYYRRTSIRHTFNYEVQNGIIYLDFDDRLLDCSIRDYNVNSSSFYGWMDGRTSSVRFTLYKERGRYSSDYNYRTDYTDRRGVPATRSDDQTADSLAEELPSEFRAINLY